MRIAVVHSYYRSEQPSGENTIVDQQIATLRAAGHQVLVVARSSDDLRRGIVARVRVGTDVARGRGHDPTRQLAAFRPDVVHVHNLFPNFGTEWLASCPFPVVATLHNFRPVCANAVLFRDGHVCTDCPDGRWWSGLAHRCYRDSAVATLPLTITTRRGANGNPLLQRADRIVVLSEHARDFWDRFGLDPDRTWVVPHGLDPVPAHPDPGFGSSAGSPRWVFVGRLSPEKGVAQLLADWPAEAPLDIIGSGPLLDQLRAAFPIPGVRFRGQLSRDELLRVLPRYTGAVVPGTNVEAAYPLTALEALSAGIPLVVHEQGCMAALVRDSDAGKRYYDASSLRAALDTLAGARGRFSDNARTAFAAHFSRERWLSRQLAVYRSATRH